MAKGELARAPETPSAMAGFNSEEYNDVVRGAKLVAIQLIHVDMDRSAEPKQDAMLKLSYGREVRACRYDANANSTAAIFRYHVTAKAGRTRVFRCIADYAVLYDVPAGSPEVAATAFCSMVGAFAAYPYFRAVAAQMAWNAGLELPPLPSIAAMPVVPKKETAEAAKEKAKK